MLGPKQGGCFWSERCKPRRPGTQRLLCLMCARGESSHVFRNWDHRTHDVDGRLLHFSSCCSCWGSSDVQTGPPNGHDPDALEPCVHLFFFRKERPHSARFGSKSVCDLGRWLWVQQASPAGPMCTRALYRTRSRSVQQTGPLRPMGGCEDLVCSHRVLWGSMHHQLQMAVSRLQHPHPLHFRRIRRVCRRHSKRSHLQQQRRFFGLQGLYDLRARLCCQF